MESRAKLLGHPIHQMLIVFPLEIEHDGHREQPCSRSG
jgi:hypothetical protein